MEEKTIMLVGATGSGKSTLVDGIVNYVMGVSFDDPFRFTLVQREDEENKMHNQVRCKMLHTNRLRFILCFTLSVSYLKFIPKSSMQFIHLTNTFTFD